ncbi:MAG: uroporphyrinogen decarboxylase family protein [Anaerolineae bacterium]
MDDRERVRLALTCQKPDRVPRALGFFSQSFPQIAPTEPEDYFGLDVRYVEFEPPPAQEGFLEYLRGLPPDVHLGNLAQLTTYYEWGYHPERGPAHPLSQVQTAGEMATFLFPDLADPRRYAGLAARVGRWHAQGAAVAGSPPHLGGELFETAWRLRGFENFLVDLAVRKPLAHYLLDQLTALVTHNALILAQAGVDVLLLDDDMAMPTDLMVSPATWREFFKPRLAQVIQRAREASPSLLVFYHSDGNFTRLVPDLVEIGVNVINPLQPDCMDALALKREFGDRLAFWGTVGTATLWGHGTPDQIRAEVRRRIETLGREGLLVAPAYDVDFAPWENVVAFCEAADEFGRC